MNEDEYERFVELARAKFIVMFMDISPSRAGGGDCGNLNEREKIRQDAYRWFFNKNSDCQEWCDLADYNIEWVREKARHIAEHGYKFRAEPRKGSRYLERKAYHTREKKRWPMKRKPTLVSRGYSPMHTGKD